MSLLEWLSLIIAIELAVLIHHQRRFAMSVRDEINRLIEKVSAIETEADSFIEVIHGVVELLRENATDPSEIRVLANRLEAQTAEIAAAKNQYTPPPPPLPPTS